MKVNEQRQRNLLCGFIDVKIPPKGRKLGPWKAWKRQWCTIQRSTCDNSIELVIGNNKKNASNSITVPQFATLCRTESRTRPYAFGIFLTENKSHNAVLFLSGISETESQKWMAHIRTLIRPHVLPVLGEEFFVSLIDNSFSRSSGLYGVYGILSLNDTEMSIRDPANGGVSATWKWSHIERNYVRESTQNMDDAGKIFVFQISKHEDKDGGGGKLYLFCPQAQELQSTVLQFRLGRQRRIVTSPLPPTPPLPGYFGFHSSRRLSRSEGDLRWPVESSIALLNLRSRSSSRERNSNSLSHGDDGKERNSLGKIARSLVLASASFSLLLSTPGCSEPDSLHEYQAINNSFFNNDDDDDDNDNNNSNIEDILQNKSLYFSSTQNRSQTDIDNDSETDDVGELFSHPYFRTISAPCGKISSRRVSGASVASGIYAEIDENPENLNLNCQYQNLSDFTTEYSFNDQSLKPPPLPPRRTNEHCVNSYTLNDLQYSFANGFHSTKDVVNQPNGEKVMNERQQSVDNGYTNKPQYILINMNKTEEKIKEQNIEIPPPPLPPRGLCDTNDGNEEHTICTMDISHSRVEPEFENCNNKKNHTPQKPEPDYLPMSQVPTKISMADDTYVVMANIINKKMSVAVNESVP